MKLVLVFLFLAFGGVNANGGESADSNPNANPVAKCESDDCGGESRVVCEVSSAVTGTNTAAVCEKIKNRVGRIMALLKENKAQDANALDLSITAPCASGENADGEWGEGASGENVGGEKCKYTAACEIEANLGRCEIVDVKKLKPKNK